MRWKNSIATQDGRTGESGVERGGWVGKGAVEQCTEGYLEVG